MERDLNSILATISGLWPNDHLEPGVTISALKDGQTYASVVRWTLDDGELVKTVVASTKRPSVTSALADLRTRLGAKLAYERRLAEARAAQPEIAHA